MIKIERERETLAKTVAQYCKLNNNVINMHVSKTGSIQQQSHQIIILV